MPQFNNHNGFTLVQAIFVLVVLGMLGTYMVTLSSVQQNIATQGLLQSRAYQAAHGGLEWGIKSVIDSSSCFNPTPANFDLDGFAVEVSCLNGGSYDEGGVVSNTYTLSSTATFAIFSSIDYVSRTLEVTIHE